MRNVPLTTLHAPILVKLGLVSLGLVSTGLPALAHHSFAAEYEGSKQITVTGT
jgi:GLTT repeat (6 copies)